MVACPGGNDFKPWKFFKCPFIETDADAEACEDKNCQLHPASKYVLQSAEKSFCPKCGKEVHLLCPVNERFGGPSFYICFHCKYIGEVGVGPIRVERST